MNKNLKIIKKHPFKCYLQAKRLAGTLLIMLSAGCLLLENSVLANDVASSKAEVVKNSNFFSHDESEAIAEVHKDGLTNMTVFLIGSKNAKERILSFNHSISQNNIGGIITECRSLIEIPIGKRNSNTSYGGICLYSKNNIFAPVQICNDAMVGHFKMLPLSGSVDQPSGSILELTGFVISNCFGG